MPAKKVKKNNSAKKPLGKITGKIVKKIIKKAPVKKAPAKKSVIKKPAPKPIKSKVQKKAVIKKTPVKIVKKIPEKKLKKVEKKIEPKKAAKTSAKAKPAKSAPVKAVSKAMPKSLAKTILARPAKEKIVEAPKAPERKNESLQKAIIVKKSEGGKKTSFKIGDFAVYPSHGVGKIIEIEKTSVLGQDFSCYLMYFEREKLTIKIPMNSAEKIGLRHLISKSQMDEVFTILRSGVKKLKGMWSRRAQEYETKINSGDIILLAEVLRDLTRDIEDSERSYSERIIYETAIHRLASEYTVVYNIAFEEAKEKVTITAKDKLNSEGKVTQKDEFDEFDIKGEASELDEDEESEDEDEEDEDGDEDEDDDYDDEDDDAPRKKRKK